MSGWRTIDLGGKPADLFEPVGSPPRAAVVYLHTFAQDSLAASATFTRLFEQHRLACVCPRGGPYWWVDRVCPDFDPVVAPEAYVLNSVRPFAMNQWNLGPRGVGLLGIDMGGQGALRLALKQPEAFPVVAAIAASIEYHELYWSGTAIDELYASKEACRQDTVPMHIHPSHYPPHLYFACDRGDPWWRGNDRLREKLAALGVGHECDLAKRGGRHDWDGFHQFAPRAVAFLAAGLDREGRRLL